MLTTESVVRHKMRYIIVYSVDWFLVIHESNIDLVNIRIVLIAWDRSLIVLYRM